MVNASDLRKTFRSTIGTAKYIRGVGDTYVITVTNDRGDSIYVPMYLPYEVYSSNPPQLPFIEIKLMDTPSKSMNIGGDIHYTETYFDVDCMYVANTGNIDDDFGEDVANEMCDLVKSYRSNIGLYMEVLNSGKEWYQNTDMGLVVHRLLEIRIKEMQK